MANNDTQSGGERRRPKRHEVDLPCKLNAKNFIVLGTVTDISKTGAGIRLHTAAVNRLGDGVTSVTIEGIGKIAATVRWQADFRVGVLFGEVSAFNNPVEAYFRENGIVLDD